MFVYCQLTGIFSFLHLTFIAQNNINKSFDYYVQNICVGMYVIFVYINLHKNEWKTINCILLG